jgi:uncharacterized membrane protein
MTANSFYKVGALFYLIGLAELAVLNFFLRDFAMTRPPALPQMLQSINPLAAYVSGVILLFCIVLIFLDKYKIQAVWCIVILILLCAASRHFFGLWRQSVDAFKSLWLIGGAMLLLYNNPNYSKYNTAIAWGNIIVLSIFFFDCGFAHFQYADAVQNLIPAFIPFHLFFTYFAGVCLLAAGIGLLIPPIQKAAALLSGIQIFGWFLLLHIPLALRVRGDQWIGIGESLAVAGICFMIYSILASQTKNRITIPA